MGYTGYTTAGRLLNANSSRGHTPWARARTPLIFVLLVSFVFSTLASISSPGLAAEPRDTTPHQMMGSHEMAGHDIGGPHNMTGHDMAGQEPCDHGQDCKCHDRLMSHCCAQAAPVAAIWSSLPCSPQLGPERCADVHAGYLRSEDINPPTPPPRNVRG
jgi:hypothetical protein